jgi:transposase-like protein
MFFETIERIGECQAPVARVSRQLGIGDESLRHWVHQAEVNAGTAVGRRGAVRA